MPKIKYNQPNNRMWGNNTVGGSRIGNTIGNIGNTIGNGVENGVGENVTSRLSKSDLKRKLLDINKLVDEEITDFINSHNDDTSILGKKISFNLFLFNNQA